MLKKLNKSRLPYIYKLFDQFKRWEFGMKKKHLIDNLFCQKSDIKEKHSFNKARNKQNFVYHIGNHIF